MRPSASARHERTGTSSRTGVIIHVVRTRVAQLGVLVVALTALVGACGGGSDEQTVNGCVIEPGTGCANIDLTGAELASADLSGADLSGTNLTDADLSGADLSEANLAGAQIVNADLSEADLTRADLTGATITGTNLADATLCGTIRTDGTTDDTSCPASTDTTAETETETTAASDAEITSFQLSKLDCGAATTGPVTVTWETEAATAVEIAVDTAAPTAHGPSGSTTVVVSCDGEPHAITITPRSDAGPGVPETEEISSD
jgi:hypothetical protein